MPPLFFLSYSSHPQLNEYTAQFYDDLATAVIARNNLLKTKEEAGFYDKEGIGHGESWKGKLTQSLQTCKVFVYIQSEAYFVKSNTFCGKEWWVFRDRLERWMKGGPSPPAERPPLFLPVLWMPDGYVKNSPPPLAVDIQNNHPSYGSFYEEHGLHALMLRQHQNDDFGDAYNQLLVALAGRILEVAKKYPLPDSQVAIPSFDQVPNAFAPAGPPAGAEGADAPALLEGEGPRYAVFAFVVGKRAELEAASIRQALDAYGARGGNDWKPFGQKKAVLFAQQAVVREQGELEYQRLKWSPDLVKDLIRADRANKIVVIVVDTWSLHLPAYRKPMLKLDRRLFERYSIVVPWHEDAETVGKADVLRGLLHGTFRLQRQYGPFHEEIKSEDALIQAFSDALRAGLSKALNKTYRRAEGDGYSTDYKNKPMIDASGAGAAVAPVAGAAGGG